jgi:DNA-binding CsgD family transcriptional regulator
MFEALMTTPNTVRAKKYTTSQRMVRGISVPEVANKWNLSAMEFEVLRQMRGYKKQVMIAESLGLSRKTVNTYLSRARAKMGCKTMYEAIMTFINEEESN